MSQDSKNHLETDGVTSAYILAGGQSSRMGSDKGLLIFRQKLLVQHGIDVLQKVFSKVTIIANSPQYQQFGIEVIPDIIQGKGPMGGIYTGLLDCQESTAFFLGCDMPFITEQAIRYLIGHGKGATAVASSGSTIHPLFGTYAVKDLAVIKEHLDTGKYKMLRLLEHLSPSYVFFEEKEWTDTFTNINTPEDLI